MHRTLWRLWAVALAWMLVHGIVTGHADTVVILLCVGAAVGLPVWWWRDRPRALLALRKARGLCVRCGYDLRGNVSGVCPECGEPAAGR